MASHPKDLMTPEEYVSIERRSEFKSEYFAGETFAMAGGSKRHSLLSGISIALLGLSCSSGIAMSTTVICV